MRGATGAKVPDRIGAGAGGRSEGAAFRPLPPLPRLAALALPRLAALTEVTPWKVALRVAGEPPRPAPAGSRSGAPSLTLSRSARSALALSRSSLALSRSALHSEHRFWGWWSSKRREVEAARLGKINLVVEQRIPPPPRWYSRLARASPARLPPLLWPVSRAFWRSSRPAAPPRRLQLIAR